MTTTHIAYVDSIEEVIGGVVEIEAEVRILAIRLGVGYGKPKNNKF
jgi:hypothetical protein